MRRSRRLVFGTIFGGVLVVVTLVGIEFLSSFLVPAWPARAMNSREPTPARVLAAPFQNQSWLADADNSWGMRDVERSIAKTPGTRRAVFVGDSFVESRLTPLSLPAAVQQRLGGDESGVEAINLSISATDPRSYYYRIRDVALELQPDVVLLFIYAGNDFMAPDQGYSAWPRWIDESAGGSLVGSVMPRTNWLLVNRLGRAAFFRSRSTAPATSEATLFDAVTAPAEERLRRIVSHVRTYHAPNVPEERLAEILSRGDNRLFDIATPRGQGEQEYLMDWMLGTLMSWEARDFEVAASRADGVRLAGKGQVEATFSWIDATHRLLRKRGVPLMVFLVPMGSVDPDYVEFWKPWPRTYSWNHICDEWHSQLAAALKKARIHHVDLRESLADVPGTYRKLDGHWSQKGGAIVAERVEVELRAVLGNRSAAQTK